MKDDEMPADAAWASGLEVVIHFGAHKTATTFLQKFLKGERAELRRQGVGYIPLEISRATIIPFVARSVRGEQSPWNMDHDAFENIILESMEDPAAAAPVHRLVISDENVAGPSLAVLNKAELYPTARGRLRVLVNQFPEARLKLMLCIRDYADFIPSVYCELLRRHKLAPLTKMLNRHKDFALSWPAYLSAIAAALPECEVQYWTYEDFVRSPADVTEAMTGVRLTDIQNAISRKVRPSLTSKAVRILQAVRQHVTDDEYQRLAECLVEHMRFDADSKLTIEDPAFAGALRERYRRDIDALHAMSEPVSGIVRRLKK
jgi:hypothetical protein